MAGYVNDFEANMEELQGLGNYSLKDNNEKKKLLLRNFRDSKLPEITPYWSYCKNNPTMHFSATINYFMVNAVDMDKMIRKPINRGSSTMLHTKMEELQISDNNEGDFGDNLGETASEGPQQDPEALIHMMCQEINPRHVY